MSIDYRAIEVHFRQRDANGRFLTTPRRAAEERFWEKVQRTDDCWTWKAGTGKGGQAMFNDDTGRHIIASRFSWKLHYGTIPKGLCVAKGRQCRGAIGVPEVLAIRRECAHHSVSALARKYSVSRKTIYNVVRRTHWKHLP